MPSGTVRTWNDDKGFGFIEPDAGADEDVRHRGRTIRIGGVDGTTKSTADSTALQVALSGFSECLR